MAWPSKNLDVASEPPERVVTTRAIIDPAAVEWMEFYRAAWTSSSILLSQALFDLMNGKIWTRDREHGFSRSRCGDETFFSMGWSKLVSF